jgi:hypothetical protein
LKKNGHPPPPPQPEGLYSKKKENKKRKWVGVRLPARSKLVKDPFPGAMNDVFLTEKMRGQK